MPRRKKPKAIPDIRRKCHATGRVLKVTQRYIELPAGFEARGKKTITDYEISKVQSLRIIVHTKPLSQFTEKTRLPTHILRTIF